MKRFRPNLKETMRNSNKNDIYSMYTHNGMSNLNYDLNNAKNQPYIKQEPLEHRVSLVEQLKSRFSYDFVHQDEGDSSGMMPHGHKRPGDPYEFDEEGGGSSCNMDGFKRGPGSNVKEEPKDAKKTNLFTSEGLQPSYKDLDQIFDNSDDTSSDEAVSNRS